MSSKKDGCLIQLLRWFNFLMIILTALCYAAPYFPPTTFWPFIFLGLGFPIVTFINVALFLFWVYRKKWYVVFPLICLVMSWGGIQTFFGHPFRSTTEVGKSKTIKILSCNAKGGGKYKTDEPKAFIKEIKAINPDIIAFQELNIKTHRFKPLREIYPYFSTRPTQPILSKYPIVENKDLELESIRTHNGAIYADIKIDNQILRLYNVHLHSNKISGKVDEISSGTELSDLNDKETFDKTKDILGSVKRTAAIRTKQSLKIKKDMNRSSYPLVICGDFNDSPISYSYKTLSKGLKDTFVEKGKGFGFSFKGGIPFLKIDYILTSPEIQTVSTQLVNSQISDHKMLESIIVFPSN